MKCYGKTNVNKYEIAIRTMNSYEYKNVILHEILIIQITIYVNKKSPVCLADIKMMKYVHANLQN